MILTKKQLQKIKELALRHKLVLIILFGSQSRNETHSESDIDIAYIPQNAISIEDEVNINYRLTLILGSNDVDTLNMHRASPLLLKQIFEKPVVLYQKTGQEFPRYEMYSMRSYSDAMPLFEMHRNELNEFLNDKKTYGT